MGGACLKNRERIIYVINVEMIGHASPQDTRFLWGGGPLGHAPLEKYSNLRSLKVKLLVMH